MRSNPPSPGDQRQALRSRFCPGSPRYRRRVGPPDAMRRPFREQPKNRCSRRGAKKVRRGAVSRVLFTEPFICDAGHPPPDAAYPGIKHGGPPLSPAWPCFGWGLPCPAGYPPGGGLLLHRFTLTDLGTSWPEGRRSVLCGTFRRLSPPGRYPAPCPTKLGLSSNRAPHQLAPVRGSHSPRTRQYLGLQNKGQDRTVSSTCVLPRERRNFPARRR